MTRPMLRHSPFDRALIANRGENGRAAAVSVQPDCVLCAAQTGDLVAGCHV
jgi:hypothetical protein